jgi:hypothetical protein
MMMGVSFVVGHLYMFEVGSAKNTTLFGTVTAEYFRHTDVFPRIPLQIVVVPICCVRILVLNTSNCIFAETNRSDIND